MKSHSFKKLKQKSDQDDYLPPETSCRKKTKQQTDPPFQGPTDQYGFIKMNGQQSIKQDKKTLNARIEKWRIMLQSFNKQPSKLIKKRVRKGIPNGLRLIVWPLLAKVSDMKADAVVRLNCASYEEFINKAIYKYEHQIKLDVLRTFPNNVNFKDKTACSESLVMVLKALSAALPDLGYCQGMNFLTASIIMITNDENAFWILYSLMTQYNQAAKYQDPKNLYREFYIIDNLIKQYYPELHKLLKQNQIDLFYFCTEWMITLFSSILPMNIFYRVFEIFLVEGEKTLFRCALTILHYKRQKLMQLGDFEAQLQYIRNIDELQLLDPDKFIVIMTNNFKFSKSQITELDKKYQKQNK